MSTAGVQKRHQRPSSGFNFLHNSESVQSCVGRWRSHHYCGHYPSSIKAETQPNKFFIFNFSVCNFFFMPLRNVLSTHALEPPTASMLVATPLVSDNKNYFHKHKKRISMEQSRVAVPAPNLITSSSNSLLTLLDCVVKFLRGIVNSNWGTPLTIDLHRKQLKQRKYLKSFKFQQLKNLDMLNSMESFTTTTTHLLTVRLQYAEHRLHHSSAKSLAPLSDKSSIAAEVSINCNNSKNTSLQSSPCVAVSPNTTTLIPFPNPIDMYSRPTFCYFVVDCRPVSPKTKKPSLEKSLQETKNEERDSFQCFTQNQCRSNKFSTRRSTLCSYDFGEDDLDDDYDGNDSDNNNNHWHDTSSSSLQERQRYLSECSDESFIHFAEDDESENEIDDGDSFNRHADKEDEEEEESLQLTDLKKVRFNLKPKLYIMRTWDFAYRSARKGNWEDYARDSERFKRRIETTAAYLDPILSLEHRNKIYRNRFADQKLT